MMAMVNRFVVAGVLMFIAALISAPVGAQNRLPAPPVVIVETGPRDAPKLGATTAKSGVRSDAKKPAKAAGKAEKSAKRAAPK